MNIERVYELDDILLRSGYSDLYSRREADIRTTVAGIDLDIPILSAPMTTITEDTMAIEIARQGGLGIIHRYNTIHQQMEMATLVKKHELPVAAAVNRDMERVRQLIDWGHVDILVLDVAHGWSHDNIKFGMRVKNEYDIPLIAGNVTEPDALYGLFDMFDGVRVGIGQGSVCLTRQVSGVGVPLATCIQELHEKRKEMGLTDFSLIVDGGVKNSGDIVKCFTDNHKILTKDLNWKSPSSLHIGDKIIGFDEFGPNRKYKISIIEHINFIEQPTYEVTLSSGDIICVTPNHKWLVSRKGGAYTWLNTTSLRENKSGKYSSKIPLMFNSLNYIPDYEDGWFSGLLDGEGNLGYHNSLSFFQKQGKVLERGKKYLSEREYHWSNHNQGEEGEAVYVRGRLPQRLNLLSKIRPSRLISKLDPDSFGIFQSTDKDLVKVETVKESGIQEVAQIQTSTGTLFVDGIPMHNCLALGADAVITGSMLAGTHESLVNNGLYYGMASATAMSERAKNDPSFDLVNNIHTYTPEGTGKEVGPQGSMEDKIQEIVYGIKIGMSYVGARTIKELQEKAQWVTVR